MRGSECGQAGVRLACIQVLRLVEGRLNHALLDHSREISQELHQTQVNKVEHIARMALSKRELLAHEPAEAGVSRASG